MADDDFDPDKVLGSSEDKDVDTDVDEPDTDTPDDDEGDSDGGDEDVESWDAKRGKAELSKRNKENQRLRERLRAQEKLTAEERSELEELRNAKLSDQEKLEARATKGEQTAAELRAENEELRIRAALGLSAPDEDSDDEDPFEDIPIKGETFAERKASALKFAEKYGIGRFAVEDAAPKRQTKTPPPEKLRRQSGDDDSETDPGKLADRVSRNKIGLLI